MPVLVTDDEVVQGSQNIAAWAATHQPTDNHAACRIERAPVPVPANDPPGGPLFNFMVVPGFVKRRTNARSYVTTRRR